MPLKINKWEPDLEFKWNCVDDIGLSPHNSKVIDPNNPDVKQKNLPVKKKEEQVSAESALAPVISGAFDPEKGYIVDDEDEGVLASAGMNEGQRKRALERRAKPMSEEELEKYIFEHNISHMGEAERDAYMRFSDLEL